MKALSFNNIFSHPKEDEDDMALGVLVFHTATTARRALTTKRR